MISWIVASHRPQVLADNLQATLKLADGDELVVVQGAPSIAAAYNQGQQKAVNRLRVYVHHDVQLIDSARLRQALLEQCTEQVGMVGVIGSVTRVLPWWDGVCRGSVVDGRMGLLDMGPGGECAYLDGLLLASVHELAWDEGYEGWHLYDHDISEQQLAAGLTNLCLTGGAEMVLHNTTGPSDTGLLAGWDTGVVRFRRKWHR